jgi:uncharacterized protein YecE (DUF72 family)
VTDFPASLLIGTAGWTLPRAEQHRFPEPGAHLARYAAHLPAAEINSSFYRPHRRATYERWAATVPPSFRFSVKIPKVITHEQRLVDTERLLDAFLADVAGLGDRLGCLLVQLPPKLELDVTIARQFFTALNARHTRGVSVEPRHPSWFTPDADYLLQELQIARVGADPAIVPAAAEPGGSGSMVYYRLHGTPRMYYSAYDSAMLDGVASRLERHRAAGAAVWCMFDNTAHGAALGNALALLERLHRP